MWRIADDIESNAAKLGVPAERLAPEANKRVRADVVARYARSPSVWPLWDGPDDDTCEEVSVQDGSAWRWVAEFVADAPCILLWDPHDEVDAIRFENGRDLVAVLEEMYLTEFYVTDDEATYLICFNHHDYLIAEGRAVGWLRHRAKQE
jgi:hypothetical protein